ncbi:MAG: DNA repair exonuclease [Armatimonadetes bacterium]|nr:DNA repair exonuclease [Armatimonadota bacterium]
MLRFLHTTDLQLGRKASDVKDRGDRQREARFEALRNLRAVAERESVDFVVVAGDLFESNQVSDKTVMRALECLRADSHRPVYILPGNHDHLGPGSVYSRFAFKDSLSENIYVLTGTTEIECGDGCVLYPCPAMSSYPEGDPLAWIPPRDGDPRVRIVLLHATLKGAGDGAPEDYCPVFDPASLQAKGIDYAALGHWHQVRIANDGRWAYPGAPEQCKFDERESGYVLVVEIEGPWAQPRIEKHQVGVLQWLLWDREIRSSEDLRALERAIEAIQEGRKTLLRVVLRGSLRADELPDLERLEKWAQARVDEGKLLGVEIIRRELYTTEDLEGDLRQLADSDLLIAQAVADLRRLANPGGGATECAGQAALDLDALINLWKEIGPPSDLKPSEVASEALAQLARIAKEVYSQ